MTLRDNQLDVPSVRWGAADPLERGPLICTNREGAPRNCIGNYGGQYVLYRAAAEATGRIDRNHHPDYANFVSPLRIPRQPHWSGENAIASFDPFGHLVPELFAAEIARGYNVRPTSVFTLAKLNFPEIHTAMQEGQLKPDGKILQENGRINVTKIAIEPVWYLPGMARLYGVDEKTFREGLYYGLGGGYRDLIERDDLKVFLPPFGETTIYILGNLADVGKENVIHAARTHDKCGSSDTHRANICSCSPGLMWGYEESVRVAQQGGVGIIVYTEAEGRGHGAVLKNGVYNARLAGEDRPEDYFAATARITGIADLREQSITTDVYRWMGVSRIDRWLSGSPHKTAAMEAAGIKILGESPLPPERLPDDTAMTEWQGKIYAHYNYEERPSRNPDSKLPSPKSTSALRMA